MQSIYRQYGQHQILLILSFSGNYPLRPVSADDLEFIDQDLQGKIGNKDWKYVGGNVKQAYDYETFGFEIVDTLVRGNHCSTLFFGFAFEKVNFTLRKEAFTIGTVEIVNHPTDYTKSQSLTIVENKGDNFPRNIMVYNGGIEITRIDTVNENIVEGKLVAKYDEENFINGNFRLKYCR